MKRLFPKINTQICVLAVLAVLCVGAFAYLFAHDRQSFNTLALVFVGATVAFVLNTCWSISWSTAEQKKKDIVSINNLYLTLKMLRKTQLNFQGHYHPRRECPDRPYTIVPLMIDNFDRRESIFEDIKFLIRLDEPEIADDIQTVVEQYNSLVKVLISRQHYHVNVLQERIRQYYAGHKIKKIDLSFIDKQSDPDWKILKMRTDDMIEFCDKNICDLEIVKERLQKMIQKKFPKADIDHFRR